MLCADVNGAMVQFNEQGDAPGRYTIMNYQRNRQSREYEYKVVGTWADGSLALDLNSIVWAGGTMDIPRWVGERGGTGDIPRWVVEREGRGTSPGG